MISRIFNNEALAVSQQASIVIPLNVASGYCTGAFCRAGFSPNMLVESSLAAQGGTTKVALTQANIDLLLGSTNEVLADTAFGTTAFEDDDCIGLVINCGGQVSHVVNANLSGFTNSAICQNSYGSASGFNSDLAIADTKIVGTQVYVTTAGNLAVLCNFVDMVKSTSSGSLVLTINVKLK